MQSLTPEDRKRIEEGIQRKYSRVARTSKGNFQYPTGEAGLKGLGYDTQILKKLPKDIFASYCGVGNPFILGPISEGESVLDVGCGAGVDTMIAAIMVGPRGRAAGIDSTPKMLMVARENLTKASFNNVTFEEASAENLPFPDLSFDVVISNGVFNLIPDKLKALKEVFRVLKPLGRFMIADQVLTIESPEDTRSVVENWAKWQGGAIPGKDFLAMLGGAGFVECQLVKHTGFNSSPVTIGVLFRAKKPKEEKTN